MVKKVFKKYMPERHDIEKHGVLDYFGDWIHDPNLWHLTRHSTSGGVANGLFWAFLPIPGQLLLGILSAIYFRVNIPISVFGVFLTNPLTIGPVFYVTYLIGASILNLPIYELNFEWSWGWFSTTLADIWFPLLFGCLLCGIVSAVIGYFLIQGLWRLSVVRNWEKRKEKKRQQASIHKE